MYVPSVTEMEAFLDLQAAQGSLAVSQSQISNLKKQTEEGSATIFKYKGNVYIATKSGMFVKQMPNKTFAVINPSSDDSDLITIADTILTKGDEESTTEDKEITEEIPGVEVIEDSERSYLSRTKKNAEWSDITIALGEDLTTAGELQTAKFAGAEVVEVEKTNARGEKYKTVSEITNAKKGKYIGVDISKTPSAKDIADNIYQQITERNLPTKDIKLNIAGNGIYTLKSEQKVYDTLLTDVIKALQDKGVTISEIRSGGQTGIDEAGIKAAMSLGIKASLVAPKGFRFRGKDNKDISNLSLIHI